MTRPQFPLNPIAHSMPTSPGARNPLAGLTVEERLAALEQAVRMAPQPGGPPSNGCTITSDTSQTGGVKWQKAPYYGKCIVATSQTVTSTSYTVLTTPDRVTVTLEADGLLVISYHALIKLTNNLTAAIFIGGNQLKIGQNNGAPGVQETLNNTSTFFTNLYTTPLGLSNPNTSNASDSSVVTTGQIVGASGANGGETRVFAAAGTYDVEIRFKVGAGTGTIKDRKLWVEAIPFV